MSRPVAASARALIGAGLFSLAFAAAACAAAPTGQHLGAPYEAGGVWFVPAADPGYDAQGLAAEYGEGLAGARTASGEAFDPRAMAAAHATLPLPGVVEVTNLDTGKTLTLRINDRGPYAPGRILSLTPAAARALGVAKGASARVRVRYAEQAEAAPSHIARAPEPSPPTRPVAATSAPCRFGVQVGAFAERARAERVVAQLSSTGRARIAPLERGDATLYRVILAADGSAAAEAARAQMESRGFTGAKVVEGL